MLGTWLPTGWYKIHDFDCMLREAELSPRITWGGEVVTCFVDERVMVSMASCWKDARRIWSITHDSEQGNDHLELEGDLPAEFTPIHARLSASQIGQDRVD